MLEVRYRAKQTVVISRHVETEPQETHSAKEETYSSTILTGNCPTHNPVRNGNHTTLGLSSVFAPHLRSGFAECRIQNATSVVKVKVRVMGRVSVTVGVVDGIYVVWCGAKSIVQMVLVLLFAILFVRTVEPWT